MTSTEPTGPQQPQHSASEALEQALRTEVAFSDTLMDSAQVLVLVLDEQDRILRCNSYACRVIGRPRIELLHLEWERLLPPADWPGAREALLQVRAFGVSRTVTAPLQPREGAERAIAWSIKTLQRGESSFSGVLVLGQDITELQEAQSQALQAERLAAIGQVTAALAHECRNLLQASQAGLERLSWRVQDRPEALALVQRVQNAHQGLARLFEDVRGYAAPIQLDCQPCRLPGIWREIWNEVRAACPTREASLKEDLDDVDLWCSADAFRLGQVFRNLFENSFAACSGPVRVQIVCREAHLVRRPAIRVVVRDNGPGLNDEQRRRIFEPFYTTRPTGTGLGMPIAKRIVEAHGGRMAVGQEGPGAEIILLLPRSSR
jgi:PAS domain S-box-containing protein